MLPEIVEAVRGTGVEVYLDSGVRTGTDVLKALALGARAVFVGRPVIWGLAYKVPEKSYLMHSNRHVVSSVGRVPVCCAGGRRFGPTLWVLKKLRRMCCLCNYIRKWLDIQVFSNKDYKP